jgi:hypothetical protein
VTTAGQTGSGNSTETKAAHAEAANSDLLQALSGLDAQRTRAVADRTRRVVLSSQGVLKEQERNRDRARSFALAGVIVLLVLLAPLVWEAVEGLSAGEHLGDPGAQLALWGILACAAMLAAVLLVGRRLKRDR